MEPFHLLLQALIATFTAKEENLLIQHTRFVTNAPQEALAMVMGISMMIGKSGPGNSEHIVQLEAQSNIVQVGKLMERRSTLEITT